MKTHILYKAMHKVAFVALGLPLLLTSCGNDWLDVSSKTDASTGNFNQTATQADILLNGCYDGWQGTVSKGPTFSFQMASEYMSDECYGGTGANDARNIQVIDRFDQSQDVSQTDLYNDLWTYYYAAIYNCNELLSMEGNYSWTEAEHGRIIGECRAIRALCYFDLVRMFENVPLVTEPVNENIPQAAPDSVYALIVRDLKYAAENIPADAYPKSEAASNDGRITKYAAEAMLGRVYLFYDGVYNDNKRGTMPGGLTAAEALAAEEDVIKSGQFSLVSNFKNLWLASANCTSYKGYWLGDVNGSTKYSSFAGNGNSETVLAMKFNYTGDYNGNNAGNRSIQWKVVRAGVKTTFASSLHFFDTNWAFQASDDVFVTDGQDGTYTVTINGSSSSPYGLYLDVAKILKSHPNCDIVITDIKVDGKSISFNDADIDRGTGDTYSPTDVCARRYILNPWGATAANTSKFKFSKSIAVTFNVKMDTGSPFIKSSAKKRARRR